MITKLLKAIREKQINNVMSYDVLNDVVLEIFRSKYDKSVSLIMLNYLTFFLLLLLWIYILSNIVHINSVY
jgi:hypothetical protein